MEALNGEDLPSNGTEYCLTTLDDPNLDLKLYSNFIQLQ